MTTKKKCMALAAEHGMTIEYDLYSRQQYFHISLPEGLSFMGQTGLTMYMGYGKNAADLWRECYSDLKTCIDYKPWVEMEE